MSQNQTLSIAEAENYLNKLIDFSACNLTQEQTDTWIELLGQYNNEVGLRYKRPNQASLNQMKIG